MRALPPKSLGERIDSFDGWSSNIGALLFRMASGSLFAKGNVSLFTKCHVAALAVRRCVY